MLNKHTEHVLPFRKVIKVQIQLAILGAELGIHILELQIICFATRGQNENDVCQFGVWIVHSCLSLGGLGGDECEIAPRSREVVANGSVLEEGVLVVVVVGVVVDVANVYDHEVVGEVLPKHEENSIIAQVRAHIQLLLRTHPRPKGLVVIRSPSSPFLTAPGITQLQHPVWLMENSQLFYKLNTMV